MIPVMFNHIQERVMKYYDKAKYLVFDKYFLMGISQKPCMTDTELRSVRCSDMCPYSQVGKIGCLSLKSSLSQ